MKKIAIALSMMAFATITLMSCSKKGNYTCSCVIDAFSGGKQTVPIPINNQTKSDAENICDKTESNYNSVSPNSAVCTLN